MSLSRQNHWSLLTGMKGDDVLVRRQGFSSNANERENQICDCPCIIMTSEQRNKFHEIIILIYISLRNGYVALVLLFLRCDLFSICCVFFCAYFVTSYHFKGAL